MSSAKNSNIGHYHNQSVFFRNAVFPRLLRKFISFLLEVSTLVREIVNDIGDFVFVVFVVMVECCVYCKVKKQSHNLTTTKKFKIYISLFIHSNYGGQLSGICGC